VTIITLTTDFGLADGYVGIMKGVILGIARDVHLVDLSHEVPPQDVWEAIYLLAGATPYFPVGTIHLAVVDPGVGSARRALVVRTDRALYVGPDNGLFTRPLAEPGAQAWELNRPEFWLSHVSRTFHGRDVFAPVVAHLANGAPPVEMGRLIADPVRLSVAGPNRAPDGALRGHVVHVDRFGNLITDVPAAWLAGAGWRCRIAGETIWGISDTYADVPPGALLMLFGSAGTLEIAERHGNAARLLGVTAGEEVLLEEDYPWKGLSSRVVTP
jgi:S-adenosyl-L-methionine hydrolase (adenosine-forming)